MIATIRSREISASIILQSQSQLKAIYKDAAEIILDNADSTLFWEGAGKMQRIFRRTWDVKQSTVSTLPKIAARRFLMASIIRNWERS